MSDDTHLVDQETGAMSPLATMSLRVHSICSQYSMGTFHQVCCTGGYGKVSPDGVGLGILPMVSKSWGMLSSLPLCLKLWQWYKGKSP